MSKDKGAKAPQSKAEMMKRLRAERKAKGFVKIEIYDTPEIKSKILEFYESLKT